MSTFVPMKAQTRRTFLATALATLPCTALFAAGRGQPHMRDAIALLNVAKKAEKPVPLLQKARKALLNARHNKGSERVDAIRAINEAIAYAQINDKKKMMAQINHAIAECHGGMAHAR